MKPTKTELEEEMSKKPEAKKRELGVSLDNPEIATGSSRLGRPHSTRSPEKTRGVCEDIQV